MKIHPAAELFPMMSGDELLKLAADISQNGQRDTIIRTRGAILDGRNRLKACEIAKVKPRFEEWSGKDPEAYVISKNLHRRHLNESQRAMVAARLKVSLEGQAQARSAANLKHGSKKPEAANLPGRGDSRDIAAHKLSVGARTVDAASLVLDRGAPEVVRAIEEGKLAVTDAAKIVDKPAAVQKSLVRKVLSGESPNLRAAARRKNDAYYTEDALTAAITARLRTQLDRRPQLILEPSSGGGAFVRAAKATWPEANVYAVDKDEVARAPACVLATFTQADFLTWKTGILFFDLIVGNPPYSDAQNHVERALSLLRPGGMVAFLLRLSFLASDKRVQLNTGPGRTLAPVVPRPSFTGDGDTDMTEYGVFAWVKDGTEALPVGDPILWVKDSTTAGTMGTAA